MAVRVPHFDFPFRYLAGGSAAVVEQNSADDVSNCVSVAVLVERGSRLYAPGFGIDDPTFSEAPLDLGTINQQILDSEPRARILSQQEISSLVVNVQLGVDNVSNAAS